MTAHKKEKYVNVFYKFESKINRVNISHEILSVRVTFRDEGTHAARPQEKYICIFLVSLIYNYS